VGDIALEQGVSQRENVVSASVEFPERPARTPQVELVGEMRGVGFVEQQWLIQRDQRFIQVTELLYRIVEHANGQHTLAEIADKVTATTRWTVSSDNVEYLIRTKLMPLGIIASANGVAPSSGTASRGRSPLNVKLRRRVLPSAAIGPVTRVLQILYAPPLLVPVLVSIVVAHAWLYYDHGVGEAMNAVLFTPGALLIVLGIALAGSVFHEFGHAAALRYSGGQVRGMGVGLYIIYPAFYTDVTDSYRLGRWGRVRTDLGGFYFHLIFAVGIMGLYWLTGLEYLLVVVLLINFDVIRQCVPFVRFDGYWALADLTGIPDFFSQMGAFLRSVVPIPGAGTKLPTLKPWVKAVFAIYIVVTLPVLALLLFLIVSQVPSLVATTSDALLTHGDRIGAAWNAKDYLGIAAIASQLVLLALPLLFTAYFLYNLAWRPLRGLWQWIKSTLASRSGASVITGVIIFLMVLPGMAGLH
jgi:putative peptide zinc metalloprotease protein